MINAFHRDDLATHVNRCSGNLIGIEATSASLLWRFSLRRMLRKIEKTNIIYLFALTGLIGLASERLTGFSETDIVRQVFFYLLGHQDRPLTRPKSTFWPIGEVG